MISIGKPLPPTPRTMGSQVTSGDWRSKRTLPTNRVKQSPLFWRVQSLILRETHYPNFGIQR